MIDTINQRFDIDPPSNLRPLDRVSGYTIKQLEQALVGARSWTQWRDNIKNNNNNDTQDYVNELFDNWPN